MNKVTYSFNRRLNIQPVHYYANLLLNKHLVYPCLLNNIFFVNHKITSNKIQQSES